MKKIFLSAFLMLLSGVAFSQLMPSVQFGVKGGANLSKLTTDNTFSSDNRAGYYVGVWTRFGAAGIHLQPELYLSGKNAKIVQNDIENNIRFTSLDVPVLIGTKIGAAGIGLRLNTGPVFSFVLDDEQKFGDAVGNVSRLDFKGQNIAWQFGAGLDFGQLGLDLRYEKGLSKVNNNPDTKLNLFTLGLALKLF
ncbi:porin family protein [Pedobacter sp. CG_S7]|uniref:porin family protein n=1 Tax=Pedobacter sp. CG_S7 TaxID=3143930 RepID=UPI0033935E97